MSDFKIGRIEFAPTQGPWYVGKPDLGQRTIRAASGACTGKTFPSWFGGADHFEANAILIAASCDLLAALKALTEHYVSLINSGDCGFWDPESEPQVIAARAAIAKAEGR